MKLLHRCLVLAAFTACCCGASAAAVSPPLPSGWSHAQINVVGPNGRPHTLIYDRGRVLSVGDSSLTLREPDGSVVTVQIAPTAVIRIDGRAGTFAQLKPGFRAQTLGVDGRPARRVQATSAPPLRANASRLRTVRRR
jgi:hypothetical protein